MNNQSPWRDEEVIFTLVTTSKHILLRRVYNSSTFHAARMVDQANWFEAKLELSLTRKQSINKREDFYSQSQFALAVIVKLSSLTRLHFPSVCLSSPYIMNYKYRLNYQHQLWSKFQIC